MKKTNLTKTKKNVTYNNKKYNKVKDYCHYNGKYTGAAHDIFNLRYKTPIKTSILEVGVEYPKHLHDWHSDLLFLPERMKINKCNKLVRTLYDKKNYVVLIRSLKQALDHGLILKKVHKVIQFNQETWLKEYTDMNTKLRIEAKNDFKKDFFKLMNNSFGKTMENLRKHGDIIKLVTTNKRSNQLVSKPNYHTTKWFSEVLLAIKMKKIKVKMNKPV